MEAKVTAFYTAQAVFGGKKEIMPWDYYPKLFEEDKRQHEEHRKKEEFEAFKEHRRNVIAKYNKKFNRGGEANE